jgi:hypothetical protein
MRIEEGKYYRTRDGRKVGPMVGGYFHEGRSFFSYDDVCSYWGDGIEYRTEESGNDLVALWTEHSPIRTETVTVRRLEPGVYGRATVARRKDPGNTKEVMLTLTGDVFSAPELRELARVALEIAEYLDAQ